jgi:hypothetical protein
MDTLQYSPTIDGLESTSALSLAPTGLELSAGAAQIDPGVALSEVPDGAFPMSTSNVFTPAQDVPPLERSPSFGAAMQPVVVDGATLECSGGSDPAPLTSVFGPNVNFSSGCLQAATINDFVPGLNFSHFGKCKHKHHKPCKPHTPLPWSPGGACAVTSGAPLLMQGDTLPCTNGGTIRIVSPAQSTALVGMRSSAADSALGGAIAAAGALVAGGILVGAAASLGVLLAQATGDTTSHTVVRWAKASKKSGKEKANDTPSWASGAIAQGLQNDETPAQGAKRIMDEKYPDGGYDTGPNSEYSKIKKALERR